MQGLINSKDLDNHNSWRFHHERWLNDSPDVHFMILSATIRFSLSGEDSRAAAHSCKNSCHDDGRKLYTSDELEAAATRILAGEKIAAVYRNTKIPTITLKRYKKLHREGQLYLAQRLRTKLTLPPPIKNDLVSRISGIQRSNVPVGRKQILQKSNEIYPRLHGSTRSINYLMAGWYMRLRKRHLKLADRVAQ